MSNNCGLPVDVEIVLRAAQAMDELLDMIPDPPDTLEETERVLALDVNSLEFRYDLLLRTCKAGLKLRRQDSIDAATVCERYQVKFA